MTSCDELLAFLETGDPDRLPAALERHAAECETCREALDRIRGLAEGAAALARVKAPHELLERLRRMPRLPAECERAQELLCGGLDGELDESGRRDLMGHMYGCAGCRAVWEAFATLREVGRDTRVRPRLQAVAALPPRQRIESRRRLAFFDLRLATAAAYLLAALTVMLIGNPASLARATGAGVDRATFYARAVVENRLESLAGDALETLTDGAAWAARNARDAWNLIRRAVGADENPTAQQRVGTNENGGTK
jgi:predicted anti-sigma-YlaC factor YlaD